MSVQVFGAVVVSKTAVVVNDSKVVVTNAVVDPVVVGELVKNGGVVVGASVVFNTPSVGVEVTTAVDENNVPVVVADGVDVAVVAMLTVVVDTPAVVLTEAVGVGGVVTLEVVVEVLAPVVVSEIAPVVVADGVDAAVVATLPVVVDTPPVVLTEAVGVGGVVTLEVVVEVLAPVVVELVPVVIAGLEACVTQAFTFTSKISTSDGVSLGGGLANVSFTLAPFTFVSTTSDPLVGTSIGPNVCTCLPATSMTVTVT
jgi:uncharacterized MnhB-related membrane protein